MASLAGLFEASGFGFAPIDGTKPCDPRQVAPTGARRRQAIGIEQEQDADKAGKIIWQIIADLGQAVRTVGPPVGIKAEEDGLRRGSVAKDAINAMRDETVGWHYP